MKVLSERVEDKVLRWAQPMGALASVVIAVFAILIQQQIASDQERRDAVLRAMNIYGEFARSQASASLNFTRYEVEARALASVEGPDDSMYKHFESRYIKEAVQTRPELRRHVMALLDSVGLLYNCSRAPGVYKARINPLCDDDTLRSIAHGPLSELFIAYRSILYCDPHFGSMYGSHINRYEEFFVEHMQTSEATAELPIYLTREDYQAAVRGGKIVEGDNRIIVELSEADCAELEAANSKSNIKF